LYIAFIDFKQAYDSISGASCGSIYNAVRCHIRFWPSLRTYIMAMNTCSWAATRAIVQPLFWAKQGFPFSPLLFPMFDCTCTCTSWPHVWPLLCNDDLFLMSDDQINVQTTQNKLRTYAAIKSLVVNTGGGDLLQLQV